MQAIHHRRLVDSQIFSSQILAIPAILAILSVGCKQTLREHFNPEDEGARTNAKTQCPGKHAQPVASRQA